MNKSIDKKGTNALKLEKVEEVDVGVNTFRKV